MRPPVVLDTNVAYVANGATPQAGPKCVIACVERLERIKNRERLLLDRYLILGEYPAPSHQPGAGDAFVKWAWINHCNPEMCMQVTVRSHEDRGFKEFPNDDDLAAFDRDDRVFVAVALASQESPVVLNASDTGWWNHRRALERHGVRVDFLCRELMDR